MTFTPVIAGVAQYTGSRQASKPLDPLALMTLTSGAAVEDSGCAKLLEAIDAVFVANIVSWTYADICSLLGQSLGIKSKDNRYSSIGGNTPQKFVNEAALAIETGKARAVLITGAEAAYAVRRADKGQVSLGWPPKTEPLYYSDEEKPGFTDTEAVYEVFAPTLAYAYLENALRAAKNRSLANHEKLMGKICGQLSKIASQNPYSWDKTPRTAEEITSPGPQNRMVCYPYTMRMSANIHVDQSASIIMTSRQLADELGIAASKLVFPTGGATLENIWFVTQRPTLHDAPALKEAARLALEQSGTRIDEIAFFDFYSCFPWAVEAAWDALLLSEDDPRPISLTGGLPYFGGPGSNYTLHAICAAAEKIRANPEQKALVTALGWYNTKWSAGVYGAKPGRHPFAEVNTGPVQQQLLKHTLPEPEPEPEGALKIETYAIVHDSTGLPQRATVMGRLENGRRALARVKGDPGFFSELEKKELVGAVGNVSHDKEGGLNWLELTN
jgi:acetyl-CoA C-acetyltransferase